MIKQSIAIDLWHVLAEATPNKYKYPDAKNSFDVLKIVNPLLWGKLRNTPTNTDILNQSYSWIEKSLKSGGDFIININDFTHSGLEKLSSNYNLVCFASGTGDLIRSSLNILGLERYFKGNMVIPVFPDTLFSSKKENNTWLSLKEYLKEDGSELKACINYDDTEISAARKSGAVDENNAYQFRKGEVEITRIKNNAVSFLRAGNLMHIAEDLSKKQAI